VRRLLLVGVVVVGFVILCVVGGCAIAAKGYRIPAASMEPTLRCAEHLGGDCSGEYSDRIAVNRLAYEYRDPERGEIVAYETAALALERCGAGGTFVHRVVGLPGDVLELRLENEESYVYVNGRRLDEPYVEAERRDDKELPPRRIAEDQYFVMGDNRRVSCDSTVWGPVEREALVGPVTLVYWPPDRIGFR
jgi:signal peptidase I